MTILHIHIGLLFEKAILCQSGQQLIEASIYPHCKLPPNLLPHYSRLILGVWKTTI